MSFGFESNREPHPGGRVRSSPIAPRWILSLALVVLVVVHLVPAPGDPERVVLGFLPWDLAWHLGWILAAGLVVLYMTGPAWPDEPPPPRQPPIVPPEGTPPRPEGDA